MRFGKLSLILGAALFATSSFSCPDDLSRFLKISSKESQKKSRKKVSIAKFEIPSDGVFGTGAFMAPNEHGGWRFYSASQESDDALVSVGTFRSLNSFSFGKYKRLVLLDVDGLTTKFNQANIESISQMSRWDYVKSLFGFDPLEKEPEGWGDPVRELKFLISRYEPAFELNRDIHPEFKIGQMFLNHEFNLTLGEFRRKMTEIWGWDAQNWSATLLGNEKHYRKLQKKIQQGDVLVVHGDLSGEISMLELARQFETHSIQVAAVDISNAIHYIERQFLLFKNIRKLPLQQNARIMLTTLGGYESKPYKDMWHFWSVPALDFVSRFETELDKIRHEFPVSKALKRTLKTYEHSDSNLSLKLGDKDLTLIPSN